MISACENLKMGERDDVGAGLTLRANSKDVRLLDPAVPEQLLESEEVPPDDTTSSRIATTLPCREAASSAPR